ncbi:MAG: ABC transporter ATP-binding protein, partial [Ornithobacterium rhinotracheale]|nr:ABC transporter ATP-binding protein [Ornithobacterium rhinotracheale]
MIKIDRLNKNFGNNEVLKDISLEFLEGNIYGIVGENGAGKTTLFRCIAGLESYSGEILSENKPLKNHLGYLETEPFFYSRITGKEYIQLLCNARNKKVNIDEKNIFGLPLEQYASTYSTGMKKKLALTAILLQENKYYILDEPFNGIDIQSSII